jgi:protein O-mannosyl-transferase
MQLSRTNKEADKLGYHSLRLKDGVLGCSLILIAGLLAYFGSFKGPFIFDDIDSIVDNPTIRNIFSFSSVLVPPSGGVTVEGRPFLNLTLALNYALGGVDVTGYHILNLIIHLLAGFLLFGVFNKLFEVAKLKLSGLLAFCIALLWTIHPLQTESVTYVIQRAESLMGLFYILSIYAYLRYNEGSRTWGVVSVTACYLGMATKEDMFSAPLIILFIDRIFISESFKAAFKNKFLYYAGIFSSWILLGYLIHATHGRGGTVGFDSGLPAWMYWLTQFPALIHYLQLAVWPTPLVFDYAIDRFWIWHPWSVLPYALGVIGLLFFSIRYLLKWSAVGLLGFYFFLLLAPTSVIPGNRQAMAEHRMYLPLAAILACLVLGVYFLVLKAVKVKPEFFQVRILKISILSLTVFFAVIFCYLTIQRNRDYESNIALWEKTVKSVPDNPFAHNSLGSAYFDKHDLLNAEIEFKHAIALNDHYVQAYSNLAILYATQARKNDFVAAIRKSLELNPTEYKPHYYFALGLQALGYHEQASEEFLKTLELKPYFADAYNRLGMCYSTLGKFTDAIKQYNIALLQRPIFPEVENNLGNAYADMNKFDAAILAYKRAIAMQPSYVDAYNNLGITYAQMKDYSHSAEAFKKAIEIMPSSPFVHNNYANILKKLGKIAEARSEYEVALRIDPTYEEARGNLNILMQESAK